MTMYTVIKVLCIQGICNILEIFKIEGTLAYFHQKQSKNCLSKWLDFSFFLFEKGGVIFNGMIAVVGTDHGVEQQFCIQID